VRVVVERAVVFPSGGTRVSGTSTGTGTGTVQPAPEGASPPRASRNGLSGTSRSDLSGAAEAAPATVGS
jgi:hypothetical protein